MTTIIEIGKDKVFTTLPIGVDGLPASGKTVSIWIRRTSDDYSWNGSAWVLGVSWLTMTEIGSQGAYKYTLPSTAITTENTIVVEYRETTIPAYGIEEVMVKDIFTDVDAIKLKTDNLPSDPADQSELEKYLKSDAGSVVADGGNTSTYFKTNLTNAINESFQNLQIKFITGTLAGQTRRISTYDGSGKFITVSEAFTTTPTATDQFVVIGRYTSAGSTLTESGIADAVCDEALMGHAIPGSLGQTITDIKSKGVDIETDTQDIQARLPATLNSGRMRSHVEAKESTLPLSTQEKLDVNAEVDSALDTAVPVSPTADSINERVKTLDDNYTIARAVKLDNLDQTLSGMESDIRGADNDTLKTLSDQVDLVKADTGSMNSRLPSDPADQSQVETAIINAVNTLKGVSSIDHSQLMSGITAIQNNTRFTASVPAWMQKPTSGSVPFRMTGNLYDSTGAMEDPDNDEILVRMVQVGGTFITDRLYEDVAMLTPLADATDQVNFPSAQGWRALNRDGVGRYSFFYKVSSTDIDEALTVEFGWAESTVVIVQARSTQVAEVSSDLNDIQVKVNSMYGKLPNDNIMGSTDKVSRNLEIDTIYGKLPDNFIMGSSVKTAKDDEIDAILEDTGVSLPDQIDLLESDIRAFPRMELAMPDYLTVPALRTKINQEGGIGLTDTTIKVMNTAGLRSAGIVQIESEIITYTGIDALTFTLTGCTRGTFGTTPATHNDQVNVLEVVCYPLRALIFQEDGTMLDADGSVSILITTWDDVDKFTGNMVNVGLGQYQTNVLMKDGDTPENLKVHVVATVNGVVLKKDHSMVVLPTPATLEYAQETGGGGTGEFSVDHNGWYDNDGVLHPWTDALAGPIHDSISGAPLDDCYITAFPVIDGEVIYSGRPTAQARSLPGGTWLMYLDAGEFEFVFIKEGYRIDLGGRVRRTVG